MSQCLKVPPVISTAQLNQKLKLGIPDNLVLLDAGANLGDTGNSYTDLYMKGHIPTARYFDMDEGVTKTSVIARSLPDPYSFVKQLRRVGINTDSEIVVYDHSGKAYNSSRLRWLLRVYGCHDVSILDGGFLKWKEDGYDVTMDEEIDIPTGNFVLTVTGTAARDIEDVKNAVGKKNMQIIDSRERPQFTGAADHSPTMCGGHVPGALNIPYTELFQADGTFKHKDELEQVFNSSKFDSSKITIAMCRTGMTVCSLVAAAELIGLMDIPIYNGSWMEWSQKEPELREVT